MQRRRRCLQALCLVACTLSVCAVGRAAPESGGPEKRAGEAQVEEADRHFKRGEDAFRHRDYLLAAHEFDAAYANAPHPDALWNAAQSWELGQEPARAASRYAEYLDVAPPDAAGRGRAGAAVARLAARLARIDVHASAGARAEIDGEAISRAREYVYPGIHEVVIRNGEATLRRTLSLRAGEVQSVALGQADETPQTSTPPPSSALVAPPRADAPNERQGLPPWTVYVAGAATLGAGALTAWSGFDTLSARSDFYANPNPATIEGGRARERRTNVLLAATMGLALATSILALFVRWNPRDSRAAAILSKVGALGEFP